MAETKEFLLNRGIKLKEKQILDLYMVIGGIPHYWKFIKRGKSVVQNINDLCFQKDGLLFNEFFVHCLTAQAFTRTLFVLLQEKDMGYPGKSYLVAYV